MAKHAMSVSKSPKWFFKNWPPRPLLNLLSVFAKFNTFLYKKIWEMIQRCDANSWPPGRKSLTITTRPGFPPWYKYNHTNSLPSRWQYGVLKSKVQDHKRSMVLTVPSSSEAFVLLKERKKRKDKDAPSLLRFDRSFGGQFCRKAFCFDFNVENEK